jgi:hypothetical protein
MTEPSKPWRWLIRQLLDLVPVRLNEVGRNGLDGPHERRYS